jgi:hypothetical protein
LADIQHSWIAVQGVDAADLLAELRLQPAGEGEGIPDLGVGELPDGWVAIVEADPAAAFGAPLSDLALRSHAIACAEDGRSLRTEARGYAEGREVWKVVVDSADPEVLSYTGDPPGEYGALVDSLDWDILQETPREDVVAAFYEIPLLLALMGCGLRLGVQPEGFRWTQLRRA